MTFRIYLCGSVKKGNEDDRSPKHFWTEDDENTIRENLGINIALLNPSKTDIDRSDYFLNFGCDLHLVQTSDLIFADLRNERGIGVGAELMYARQAQIPVISWLPHDSHYRRDLSNVFGEDLKGWIHPFAFSLSDYIEESLIDICCRAELILSGGCPARCEQKSVATATKHFLNEHPEFLKDRDVATRIGGRGSVV